MEAFKNIVSGTLMAVGLIAIMGFGIKEFIPHSNNTTLNEIIVTPTEDIPSIIPTDVPSDTPVPPPPQQNYPQHCMELPSYGGFTQPVICN